METFMDQSIFLRSDCGGKGVCKKCQVKIIPTKGNPEFKKACKFMISEDISIEIPEISMLSSHIISKAAISLPAAFKDRFKNVDVKMAMVSPRTLVQQPLPYTFVI